MHRPESKGGGAEQVNVQRSQRCLLEAGGALICIHMKAKREGGPPEGRAGGRATPGAHMGQGLACVPIRQRGKTW